MPHETCHRFATLSIPLSRDSRRRTRNRLVVVPALLVVLVVGCRREATTIDAPATPVLTGVESWGVVESPYSRIHTEASDQTVVLVVRRRGDLVRIIGRGPSVVPMRGRVAYWYDVQSGVHRGWVHGSEIAIFPSRRQAEDAAIENASIDSVEAVAEGEADR